MSTIADLMSADFKENSARFNRYWRASSLPTIERRKHRPAIATSRRDRVMIRLIRLTLRFTEDRQLSRRNK